jgi:O-antigen/teichoic acid export membrane protein
MYECLRYAIITPNYLKLGVRVIKPHKESHAILKGTLLLTVSALIVKVLSAFYRIPFQNLVGDVGFYIYQQAYPFYGMALVLCTYGFPVIISKLYIEKMSVKDIQGAKKLIVTSSILLSLIGVLLFVALFYGAPYIASFMKDPHIALLLKAISFIFLLIPFLSIMRGVFQGSGDMKPTAISQVTEQFIRVSTILVVAFYLRNEDLYTVGAGAMFGSIVGGIVAVLVLLFFFKKRAKYLPVFFEKESIPTWSEARRIIKVLCIQGFAISVSSMLLLFIQLGDSLNLYSLLLNMANEQAAKEMKGIYDRGLPLIQLGTVVATSMSLSLVPIISSEKVKKDISMLHDRIRLSLLISVMVGIGASIGLISIIEPTNIFLFQNSEGSSILAMQSTIILLSSLIITLCAVLQGLGKVIFPAITIVLGCLFKYLFNIYFVPLFGAYGAAFASVLSLVIIAILLFMVLLSRVKGEIMKGKELIKVAVAALIMFFVLKGYRWLIDPFLVEPNRLEAGLEAMFGVFLGGLSYLIIILKLHTFKESELSLLPLGSKLIKLLPKKNRS